MYQFVEFFLKSLKSEDYILGFLEIFKNIKLIVVN